MKLISCYIENFGAIAKKQIGFDERLTSVCEENGCGKTTLAAFLEALGETSEEEEDGLDMEEVLAPKQPLDLGKLCKDLGLMEEGE